MKHSTIRITFASVPWILALATLTPAASTIAAEQPKTDRPLCSVPHERDHSQESSVPHERDHSQEKPLLEACGGVLQPPRIGDGEIVTIPPKGGTMPIIKPKDLDENNQN